MAILEDTAVIIGTPLVEMWSDGVLVLPFLFAALLIIVFGYLVGALVGHIVRHVLVKTKLVTLIIKKMGLYQEMGKWNLPHFFGLIVKWYIFVIFLNPAAQVVKFNALAAFFSAVALWIPNIILAILIVMGGFVLAEYLAKKIRTVKSNKNSWLASVAKIITMVYVVIIALRQIGLEVAIAENTFLIILAGVMFGLAIAFGLGFKDDARALVKEVRKKL